MSGMEQNMLFNINQIAHSYNTIVQNITGVNKYSLVFKEDMDSVMYMMVARSLSKYDVEEELGLENPDTMIRQAEEDFEAVRATTVSPEAVDSLDRALKLLSTLHKRVNDISATVKEIGHYDDNMESLDVDIYVITEMIQERISEYIYYESVSMEAIRQKIDARRTWLVRFAFLTAFGLLVISVWLTAGMTRSVTGSFRDLMESARLIGAGNLKTRAKEEGIPEIRSLAHSFNSMAEQIGNLVESNRQEQIHLRDLELKLLQAQIDPHFLYNTLDNIVWLAEDGRKEDVEGIATSLSTFFRTALSGGRDVIPIREEERHIRSYLEIQQFRYSDMLTYSIEIEPDCADYMILKMTLQPIVENALYHGIKNKRGGGHILIRVFEEDERVKLVVSDTGIGMTREQLTELIRMVDGRESRLQEESAGLVIDSTYGEGTRVEMSIPKITGQDTGTVLLS